MNECNTLLHQFSRSTASDANIAARQREENHERILTNRSTLGLALLMAVSPSLLASTTWYVSGLSGNDNNSCLSPQIACRTIGHAIALAASGDSVMVAAATYVEHLPSALT